MKYLLIIVTIYHFHSQLMAQEYLNEPRYTSINDLSLDELRLLRNEIFARNGHSFSNDTLRQFFSHYGWYKEKKDFKVKVSELTKNEQIVINIISSREQYLNKLFHIDIDLFNCDESEQSFSLQELPCTTLTSKTFSLGDVSAVGDPINIAFGKFGKIYGIKRYRPCCDDNVPDSLFSDWVSIYLFQDVIVVSWRDYIQSISCLTDKYHTGDGLYVGMKAKLIQEKYPMFKIIDKPSGVISISCVRGVLYIAYDNGIITGLKVWNGNG